MEDITPHTSDSEYIIIPNPIYDVVFRYLMEDPDSAKIVISTLINEHITQIRPEFLTRAERKAPEGIYIRALKTDDIRLFHLDFTATIALPDGTEELVRIELQKASEPDDAMRLKRYLRHNFQKKAMQEVTNPDTHSIQVVERPIRLIPIFILNFRIENEVNDLLIQVSRTKTGFFKNQTLQKANHFIDHLCDGMIVVQLPNLQNITEEEYSTDEHKRKLYALLKLFDQKSKVRDNEHRLRIIRRFFPGFLDRVIRRLQAADSENPDLEDTMFAEDEYLRALIERDNKIIRFQEIVEEKEKLINEKDKTINEKDKTINEKEKALQESQQVIGEKEKVISEKEKALQESQQAISEKEKALQESQQIIRRMAKALKDTGLPHEEIRAQTGLPLEDIDQL